MSNAWLYATKRFGQGRGGVKRFAKNVKVDVDDAFLDELQFSVEQKMSSGAAAKYTQADLFKKPGMKKTTFIELTQWFSTKMVYYGLSLSAGGLGKILRILIITDFSHLLNLKKLVCRDFCLGFNLSFQARIQFFDDFEEPVHLLRNFRISDRSRHCFNN